MKIPKTFTPDKNLDKHIERLLSKKEDLKNYEYYDENNVVILLKKCKKFIDKQTGMSHLDSIHLVGERLADELEFTKKDIEEAIQRITPYGKECNYSGFYFSALINKVIEEQDVINLTFYEKLSGIGAYLKTGTLIIDGYVEFALGHCMEGGTIIIKKDAGTDVGNGMLGGNIRISGDTGKDLGIFSKGGDITVYGKIGKIADTCRARVFTKYKQVWPK